MGNMMAINIYIYIKVMVNEIHDIHYETRSAELVVKDTFHSLHGHAFAGAFLVVCDVEILQWECGCQYR